METMTPSAEVPIFAKAFLSERQDDWREGIAEAFHHFGGVPQVLLCDNARALVMDRDRVSGEVRFNPAFLQFCRNWEMAPRARILSCFSARRADDSGRIFAPAERVLLSRRFVAG